jgi:hypothetical protein
MPNGVHALAILPPDPPAPIRGPDAAPDGVERRIGDLVADAAILVCTGMMDGIAGGRLRPSTRARVGDLFVRMYELQEETMLGEKEFHTIAKREGRRELIARLLSADGTVPDDAALGEIIGWPLEILAGVTAKEAEYQRTHAH